MGIWRWAVGFSLLGSPLAGQWVVEWTRPPVQQIRFLYAHMRTEFAGCLYGTQRGDTTTILFFVSGAIDPRTASDSGVQQDDCPDIFTKRGSSLVAIVHSHIRRGALCFPSARDFAVLRAWQRARFGAIMCAQGDTILTFTTDSGYGKLPIPILDSLYAP